MSPRSVGLLIGAAFGLLFVLLNAHAPVNAALGWGLRAIGVLAFAVLIYLLVSAGRTGREPEFSAGGAMFGTGYRFVVLGEVVALFGGIALLRVFGAPGEATIAWVAFVVGLHFVALAFVWKERSVQLPGIGLTALGVLGLVLSATPAVAWVPLVSGVLSGFVLLGGSLWVAGRTA